MNRRRWGVHWTCAVVVFSALLLAGCASGAAPADGSAPAGSAATAPSSAGDDSEEALRATAQAYVEAVNANDQAAATQLTCTGAGPGSSFERLATDPGDVEITEVRAPVPEAGLITLRAVGAQPRIVGLLAVTFDGQRWCVD